MKELLLLAASGLAREVACADQDEYCVVGMLDDDPGLHGSSINGIPVIGGLDLAIGGTSALLVCVGSGTGRRNVVERLLASDVDPARFATLIDRSARVPDTCTVGAGSILLANVVLTANVTVGGHVVAMPNVTLTHDVIVENYATLTAGVSVAGSVIIGEASYLGMNATVRERLRIGAGAIVGMGAAVTASVPAGETWTGVPARVMRTPVREGVGL